MDPTQIELSLNKAKKELEIICIEQQLYAARHITTVVPAPVVPTPVVSTPVISEPVSDTVSDNVAAAGRRAVARSRNEGHGNARRRSTVSTPVKNNCVELSKAITYKLQKNQDQLISKILQYFKSNQTMNKEQFEPLKKNTPQNPFTTKWISGNHGLLSSLTRNAEKPWMKKEQQLFGSIIHPCLDPKLATIIWLSPIWREAIDKS